MGLIASLNISFSYSKAVFFPSYYLRHISHFGFENTGLKKEDAVFDLNKKSCLSVTENVLKDGLKPKMRNVAKIIRRERDYKNTALLYEKLIFNEAISPKETPALSYTNVYGQ